MEQFLFLLTGLVIGFVITWLWSEIKLRNKYEKNTKSLENALNAEKMLRTNSETELRSVKKSYEDSVKQMKDSFEAWAGKAMQGNSEHFIKLAQQTMDKYIVKATDDYDKRRESIEKMVLPLKDTLDKHEKLVKEMQLGSQSTFGSLKNYLEELGKSQKSLEKETNALVTALKAPKVRGRWGEIGLKRIVEFSGLSSFCDFNEQVSVDSGDGKLRPDMIVNLPDNKKIVIDSKVPLNAFLEAIESDNEETRKQKYTLHCKAVANHLKNLSSKAYWNQFDNTVDFVVLYIEVESAFGAALIEDNSLILEGIRNRIVFATPTTLIALLQTVAYTWKQYKATENAQQIWTSARDLYDRLAVFTEYIQKIGNSVSAMAKTYNQAVGSWESRVEPALKKMVDLGVKSEKKEIDSFENVETQVKNFNK